MLTWLTRWSTTHCIRHGFQPPHLPVSPAPRHASGPAPRQFFIYAKRSVGSVRLWLYAPLKEPLHNSLRSVISRARAVCFVVFLANSPAIGKKRHLAAHPDPSATASPELCRGSLSPDFCRSLAQAWSAFLRSPIDTASMHRVYRQMGLIDPALSENDFCTHLLPALAPVPT